MSCLQFSPGVLEFTILSSLLWHNFWRRTHRGSGERLITIAHLKQVAHLCQQKAAERLNVGNTRFKTACRELGMRSWPYRKIKSVRSLKEAINTNRTSFNEVSMLQLKVSRFTGVLNSPPNVAERCRKHAWDAECFRGPYIWKPYAASRLAIQKVKASCLQEDPRPTQTVVKSLLQLQRER